LNSSVIIWPKSQTVVKALKDWARQIKKMHNNVLKIGYFGSYAKGNNGVGSDLDVVMIIKHSDKSFLRRAAEWNVLDLPVPTDLLVYTLEEWQGLAQQEKFYVTLKKEINWIYNIDESTPLYLPEDNLD